MSATQNYVTAEHLLNITYSMIAVASAVVIARIAVQISKPRKLQPDDYFLYASFIIYIVMSTLYIIVTPAMYRVSDFVTGIIQPYPTMQDDFMFIIKIFFTNTMIFWCVLWMVKLSLLFLYRRLLLGLHDIYTKLWWGVLAFCLLSWIGCIVSNLTSCSSMRDWFTVGACDKPENVRAQIASLYYSYAVDVLSDLMIMFLPLKLVWNLQMSRARKIGVLALFGTGFICILFATLRVIQIGTKAGNSTTPSSSWLALWAVVECCVAIIIGCCPAFASLFNRSSRKTSYNQRDYSKRKSAGQLQRLAMHSIGNSSTRDRKHRSDTWIATHDSQEELAVGVAVTTPGRHELDDNTTVSRLV